MSVLPFEALRTFLVSKDAAPYASAEKDFEDSGESQMVAPLESVMYIVSKVSILDSSLLCQRS